MTERINCEEIAIPGRIKTEFSGFYEEVERIIPKECPALKLEPDLQVEFEAVTNIKSEGVIKTAGQFEIVYIDPPSLLCRLCAIQSKNTIHMLDPSELYKNIIEKIELCLPITVRETDNLPKQACRTCLEKLELCYQFHKSVAEAEKQLLMSGEQVSGKLEETEEYCQASPLRNGQRNAREKANDTTELQTSSCTDVDSSKSGLNLEETILIDEIVMDSIISSNLKPCSNNSDGDRRDKSNEFRGQRVRARMIRCGICGEAFQSVKKLHIHAKLHASTNYYPCCFCNEILTEETDWRKHCLEHTQGKKLRITAEKKSCDESAGSFIAKLKRKFDTLCQKSSTAEQIRTDKDLNAADPKKNDRAVKCTFCRLRFRSDLLKEHEKTCNAHLPPPKKMFSCAYCLKKFERKFHLIAHIRSHTGEQPFGCNLCGQRFKGRRARNDHVKIHRDQRVFECFICKKTFSKLFGLSGHARVHRRQNTPSDCPICGRNFDTLSMRNHHLRIHPGERPCQCDYCGTYFRKKGSLLKHISTQHGPVSDEA